MFRHPLGFLRDTWPRAASARLFVLLLHRVVMTMMVLDHLRRRRWNWRRLAERQEDAEHRLGRRRGAVRRGEDRSKADRGGEQR